MIRLAAHMVMALIAGVTATVASAQNFSDSYNFLKGVRERDGQAVTDILNKPGTTVINSRDAGNGETALQIVVARQDLTWLSFLLGKGADPNIGDSAGNTPLMAAVEANFDDGVRRLLASRADINRSNRSGETPLIRAVQRRNLPMVRLLIANGADPDRRDLLAGMSARDYARADKRTPQILEAMASAKPKLAPGAAGPR